MSKKKRVVFKFDDDTAEAAHARMQHAAESGDLRFICNPEFAEQLRRAGLGHLIFNADGNPLKPQ